MPPGTQVKEAQCMFANQILNVQRANPDSLVIVLADFNKGNLSLNSPNTDNSLNALTKEGNTLDHCYTTVSGAYHAVPRAALGHSDYAMVHRIPAYRQKLKLCKPAVRTSKQ